MFKPSAWVVCRRRYGNFSFGIISLVKYLFSVASADIRAPTSSGKHYPPILNNVEQFEYVKFNCSDIDNNIHLILSPDSYPTTRFNTPRWEILIKSPKSKIWREPRPEYPESSAFGATPRENCASPPTFGRFKNSNLNFFC